MKSYSFLFALLLMVKANFAQHSLKEEIGKIIRFDTEINYDLTPGFIVGIIDHDSTYIISFGKSLDEGKNEINKDDVFEIASLTKPFTATLLHVLAEKGKLQLDDRVNDHLPGEFQNPRLSHLTINDLINQNTDFPKRPAMFGEFEDDPQNPYSSYSKQDLLEFYKNYVPEDQHGFNYSHVNFGLLELIVEHSTGTEFAEAMSYYIFKPLYMNHSMFHFKEQKRNVVTQGLNLALQKVNPWTFNSFAASEGMKSSVDDLLKFTRTYGANSNTYLDAIAPRLIKSKIVSFNEDLYYSSGWYSINVNKRTRVLASSGRTNGHSSFIGMVPENKTSVVVLSNSSYGTMDLGMLILRMINNNWKRKPQQ